MTSLHHPKDPARTDNPRPARCLRHSVWMAVCDDCRDAHAEHISAARERTATAR